MGADWPINEEGFSDDFFSRKISPVARVRTVHGVVAHDHVVVGTDARFVISDWQALYSAQIRIGELVIFVQEQPSQSGPEILLADEFVDVS